MAGSGSVLATEGSSKNFVRIRISGFCRARLGNTKPSRCTRHRQREQIPTNKAHSSGNSGSRIDVPGAASAGDVRASLADEASLAGAVESVAAVASAGGSRTGFEVDVGRSGNRGNSAALTPGTWPKRSRCKPLTPGVKSSASSSNDDGVRFRNQSSLLLTFQPSFCHANSGSTSAFVSALSLRSPQYCSH